MLDVFVNEGKAEQDGLDQDATIRIIQDQRQAVRLGSVIPDLTPVHYLPRPRPPVPRFSQVPSSLGKRFREDAAIQETPSHSKRSRHIEIAQTQDDSGMVRSIEHSPELVHDTQRSGLDENAINDEDGNIVKAESSMLRRSIRDIEPATGDELEWLSERPDDSMSPRNRTRHNRQGLQPRINGVSKLPITPPTDSSHLAPNMRRYQISGSPGQHTLSTSGSRFKDPARRDPYTLPVDSDIEDSQMPVPDQPAPIPRLAKNMSSIEGIPSRQPTEGDIVFDAQDALQPMTFDQTVPSASSQPKTKPVNSDIQDDESADDADLTYTSAKASTIHEEESDEASPPAAEKQSKSTTTSAEESDSEEESEEESSVDTPAVEVAPARGKVASKGVEEDGDESEEGSETSESDQEESEQESDSDEKSKSQSVAAFETQKEVLKPGQSKDAAGKVPKEQQSKAKKATTEPSTEAAQAGPVKKPRGRPKKNPGASIITTTTTPAKKDEDVEMVDGSVQTKSTKRGPMSKLVNEASRRRNSDLDSPGEQLSQSLQESAQVASIPETVQDQGSTTNIEAREKERRASSSSAASTPTRERIGLGITDSPRKSKSITMETPPSTGKPALTQKMKQMRRSSSASAAAGSKASSEKNQSSSTNLGEETNQESLSWSQLKKERNKAGLKGRKKARKMSKTSAEAIESVTETQPPPTSTTKGTVLPPGMTLVQYNAIMSTSNITEEERTAHKKKTNTASRIQSQKDFLNATQKKDKLAAKSKQIPEITISVENSAEADEPLTTACSKTPKGKSKTKDGRSGLSVAKTSEERSASTSIDDFNDVTRRLSSIQSSEKGSMPPPDLRGILKTQSSFDRRSSTSGSDTNKDEQSAVKAPLDSGKRPSPAASSQSRGTSKPGSAKGALTSSKKATPTPLNRKAANSEPTGLKALRAQLNSQRASQNSSPVPGKKEIVSKTLQIGGKETSSDEDETSSDDESEDHATTKVVQKRPLSGVDKSIRDPTPEDDSDSD